ncbi:OsmC family protein [Psychromarinibacter halotolerans]|uniref:OsmC family protein n=1 Tax=Psychromarinibacter halotolerans TaxID=1775175 RepID=A0ABV7GT60_9RHOB|nr:OsmC family protein [Psychromarinibacter halotolerans]MAQ86293.1 OsmC family peroxiredoxin [Maritimibacter sp.]MDF0596955.1 OsmC family protein [Psychromarinibacter halotolerans]
MIHKTGSAKWSGGLKDGKGFISTETGVLSDQPYGFNTRFEDGKGTNPEELLGAAHAACFSMALSNILGDYDMVADSIETTAKVTLDPGSLTITKVHLDLTASIPGGDDAKFQEAAGKAKEGCPVSKLFDAEITLDAKLA